MLERIDGQKKQKKAYSIASIPTLAEEKKQLQFYVKKASEDGMSHFLTQEITIGYQLKITGPVGHFLDSKEHSHYLLISTGSGLTPIFSHLLTLKSQTPDIKIAHVYGERHQDFLITEMIDHFQDEETIRHFLHLSQDEKPGRRPGYIQNSIDEALHFLGTTDIQVLICGKPSMVDELITLLIEKGISKENIILEKY
jgi:ferredoxin-NADP reductase